MYNRLTEFAETFEILYCFQFGFRKNHSTSLALIHPINKISSAIDRHEIPAGVFLDLYKSIWHSWSWNPIAKLEHYDICDLALKPQNFSIFPAVDFFYFSCRQQFVQFNEVCSTTQTIKCGVSQDSQGSILGPLFFILYIMFYCFARLKSIF